MNRPYGWGIGWGGSDEGGPSSQSSPVGRRGDRPALPARSPSQREGGLRCSPCGGEA